MVELSRRIECTFKICGHKSKSVQMAIQFDFLQLSSAAENKEGRNGN
jgi:hypothetical protein